MKIGTDFSGIGSPEQAIKNLGIEHEVVFNCEIDKHARNSYDAMHQTKQTFEDITNRNHSEIEQLDLYVAGFPCQAFSIAGHRKGFEDVRGTLFFNVADFIKENQPKTFILENVKGLLSHDNGRTFQTIIDLLSNGGGTVNGQLSLDYCEDGLGYHIYYKVLNTKEHGIPQNRERIFIVGFKEPRDYRFPIAEPLKLKLKDLLEEEVSEKYYLSEKAVKYITTPQRIEKKFTQLNGDIALCMTAKGQMNWTGDFIKVKSNTKKGFEVSNNVIQINIERVESKTRRVRVGKEVAQTIDTKSNQAVLTNRIRRLTPLECWRLQGFSDEQFFKAQKVNSDTQLYKQAGNSITVNVIQKIIENINK